MAAFHSSLECAALSNPGLVIVYEYALERSKSFVNYKLTPPSYFFVGGGVGAPTKSIGGKCCPRTNELGTQRQKPSQRKSIGANAG